jgi:nucleoside-diphosphate-sugar epimerase
MRILVTGASGFVGKNLLLALPQDWEIVAQYHRSTTFKEFLASARLTNALPLQADLATDAGAEQIAASSSTFNCCVFLAANGDPAVSAARPAFDLTSNALTLVRLLERVRFEKFIYFSSGAVYDGLSGSVTPSAVLEPHLPYAISKLASESYLKHFRRQGSVQHSVAVRFFGAYGPYEPPRKVYSRLVRQFGILRDPQFTIRGDGRNLIDAMHVSDAVRAILLLIERAEGEVTLDLYSGRPLSLTELVQQAADVFGLKADIRYEGHVPEYIQFHSVDRTQEAYGFTPNVDLQTGLIDLLAYLKETNGA